MYGGSAPSFRVDLASGEPVVLKRYIDALQTDPHKEAYASGLLDGLNLPVTRYLAIDETCAILPFRFALTNFLPGESAHDLREHPGIRQVYRQMGELLRRLHGVSLPGYGALGPSGIIDPVPTNAEQVRRRAKYAFEAFRKRGGDDALASRLEAIVASRMHIAVGDAGAVFAHDDIHPGNVLAAPDEGGRLHLTGLVDFGNARADGAVSDLAKAIFNSEHMAPGCGPAIREGYGPIPHPDPEAALWFYTLVHRVSMWSWLRYVGAIPDGGEEHDLIGDLRTMVAEAA